uniref:Uncharacterized protein n=1 Tax=Fagus sylvatica TaxID=28930 RepID=A0A2N9IMG5_FAGSY
MLEYDQDACHVLCVSSPRTRLYLQGEVHYVCSVRVGAINELITFQQDNLPTDEDSGKVPPVKQKSLPIDGESDRGSTQQRKQSFEDHDDDGFVDEVNDVGFHPLSKLIGKESDSHFSYSPLP